MVMSEVSLRRIEELLLGIALQLRPTLAKGDPAVLSVALSHSTRPRPGSRRIGRDAPLVTGGRGPRWPR